MQKKKFTVHYAWIICLAGTLLFFTTIGLGGNCYSIYQPYLRDAFRLTESQLSFMNTSRQISGIIAIAVIGIYYKKISLKWGMILAACMSMTGFVILALARNYYVLVLACLLSGFGNNLGCMVPISMMMDRWFVKDRSLAVSICSSASGIATFIAPAVITGSIAVNGLSITLGGQAAVMALCVLLCAFLFCETPAKKHMTPYGTGSESAVQDVVRKDPPPLPKLLWGLIFVMVFFLGGISGCAFSSLPLLAKSQGYSDTVMANAVSLAGVSLLIGKLLFGWLCERFTQYKTTMVYGLIMVFGLVLLCFSAAGTAVLYIGSILYIGALAMSTIGLVTWTEDWIKQSDWVRCRSLWMLDFNIGSLVFSMVPGILADRFNGSYLPAFYILLGESVVCMIIIFFTYRAARK